MLNIIDVKQLNKEMIREVMKHSAIFTKASVAQETGLSVATCNTFLNEFLKQKEIIEIEQTSLQIGRPARQYVYNNEFQYVSGMHTSIEKDGYKLGYVIADGIGQVVMEKTLELDKITSDIIVEFHEKIFQEFSNIKAIGIGIPGVIQNGTIAFCDIKELEGVNLRKLLSDKFDGTIIVENDMNFVSYGIHKKMNCKDDIAAIYFPSHAYIGCGFVVNGRVLKGNTLFAGEISYIADAYGIKREEQRIALRNKKQFREIVSKLMIAIITTINPAKVFMTGEFIEEEDVQEVIEWCAGIVDRGHIPSVEITRDINPRYIDGLIHTVLDSLKYHFDI